MSEADDGDWVECPSLVGECTCDHDRDRHGWGSCGVDDCPCEAGWEE